MAALTHPVLTPAEFAALMERAGWNAPMELIDGEVIVIPPTGGAASLAQTEIVRHIAGWQTDRGAGGRLLTDVFVRVGDAVVAPDVSWWSAGREPAIGWGAIDAVPDLAVEVRSPSTRANDLGPKRALYMRAGVRELWLVDPAERAAVIVTASAERRLGAGDELSSFLLPGLAIAVSELLA